MASQRILSASRSGIGSVMVEAPSGGVVSNVGVVALESTGGGGGGGGGGGTFVCGISQRWDVGLWDSATWDGQLGICPPTAAIMVNFYPLGSTAAVNRRLVAQVGAITLTPYICALLHSVRSIHADTASIVVSGNDAGMHISYRLQCDSLSIKLNLVAGWCTLTPYWQPGQMQFGIPVKLRRW